MEYLRNVWNNVTNTVVDWWYYYFGIRGSQQLLLEYVIMDEDLSTRYVNTGDKLKSKNTKIEQNKFYKDLFEEHDKNVNLSNGSNYKFLFEQNEY